MVCTIHVKFIFFLLQTQLVERLSSQDSSGEPISEEAIFKEVLGHRSSYKKGWDPLPKGSSSIENVQLKEQLQEHQEQLSQQDEKLSQQDETISRHEEIIHTLQTRTEKMHNYL